MTALQVLSRVANEPGSRREADNPAEIPAEKVQTLSVGRA